MRVLKGFCRFAANPDVQDRVSFKSIPFVYFAKKIIAPFPFLATAISKVYEKVVFDQLYVAFHAHLSHNSWSNAAVGLHSWKWLRTGGGVWTTGRLLWLWQWICPKHWVLLTITSKVEKKKDYGFSPTEMSSYLFSGSQTESDEMLQGSLLGRCCLISL